jgi:CarD family transcriptional regulator
MAQKMPPAKVVVGKKAGSKPSRRSAHPASGAKAGKAKPKAVAAKAPAKRPAKPVAAKTAPARAVPAKQAVQAKAQPTHKAAAKEPAKKATAAKATPYAAPKHEAARPPVKPAPATKAPTTAIPVPPPAVRSAPPGAARSMPAAVAKAANQKIIAPAAPVATAQPARAPAASAAAAAAAAAAALKKPVHQRHGFKVNEWIVYPAHGVGRIVAIEEQEIAGIALELFVITFEKDKMTLRVPTGKSESVGMRKLADEPAVKKAIETLKGRARIKRTMWSRRAQEYEAKINSGDLIAIAEVVRDLYRSESQPEQSYSERQLYEAALDRMAREIAVVEKLDERGAVQRIIEVLAKSARGRRLAAEEAEEKAA